MKEIQSFMTALHKCTDEKLIAFLERREEDEYLMEQEFTQYLMALEEATRRKLRSN